MQNIKLKKLKLWNGRGQGVYYKSHLYVAAYSQKQACELIEKAVALPEPMSLSDLRIYFDAGRWSDIMKGINVTEPSVYAAKNLWDNKYLTHEYTEKPFRII